MVPLRSPVARRRRPPRGQPVIANVLHGEHFVLVVGTDARAGATTLYVNDPGFYRITYDYAADVVGWRLFNMTQAASQQALRAVRPSAFFSP